MLVQTRWPPAGGVVANARETAQGERPPARRALPPQEVAALIVWLAAAPAELVLNEAVVSPLEEQGWPWPGPHEREVTHPMLRCLSGRRAAASQEMGQGCQLGAIGSSGVLVAAPARDPTLLDKEARWDDWSSTTP